MTAFTPTHRSKVKRLHERGRYDEESVFAILDAGILAHIGYVIDGQPYVTPTAYWRRGRTLYWHGSSASRMLRTQKVGIPACVTVSLLDGLVVARSGFHHSVNYRAVMAFGRAHIVEDAKEKEAELEYFIERIYPGRVATLHTVIDGCYRQQPAAAVGVPPRPNSHRAIELLLALPTSGSCQPGIRNQLIRESSK